MNNQNLYHRNYLKLNKFSKFKHNNIDAHLLWLKYLLKFAKVVLIANLIPVVYVTILFMELKLMRYFVIIVVHKINVFFVNNKFIWEVDKLSYVRTAVLVT